MRQHQHEHSGILAHTERRRLCIPHKVGLLLFSLTQWSTYTLCSSSCFPALQRFQSYHLVAALSIQVYMDMFYGLE